MKMLAVLVCCILLTGRAFSEENPFGEETGDKNGCGNEDNALDVVIDMKEELDENADKEESEVAKELMKQENIEKPLVALEKLKKKYKFTPTILFNAKSAKGINLRSRLPYLNKWIQWKIEEHYTTNTKVAFKLLGKVSELLRVSYAGCEGYNCSFSVLEVFNSYQNMMYDSLSTSGVFIRNTIRALKYHKKALWFLNYNRKNRKPVPIMTKMKHAYNSILRCGNLADNMEKASERMEKDSDVLIKKAEKALFQTKRNKMTVQEAAAENAKKNGTLQVQLVQLEQKKKSLENQKLEQKKQIKKFEDDIKKHKEEVKKILNRAAKTTKKCNDYTVEDFNFAGILSVGKRVVTKCHAVLDEADSKRKDVVLKGMMEALENLQNERIKVMNMELDIQKSTADMYQDLSKTMEELGQIFAMNDKLAQAEHALKVAVGTLILVKTIFMENKRYWKEMTKNVNEHASSEDTQRALQMFYNNTNFGGEGDLFKEQVIKSGLDWLVLGKVSRDAHVELIKAKKHVNANYIKIPTYGNLAEKVIKEEAGLIIAETTKLIKLLEIQANLTAKDTQDAAANLLTQQCDEGNGPEGGPTETPISGLFIKDEMQDDEKIMEDVEAEENMELVVLEEEGKKIQNDKFDVESHTWY